jgi:Fe-Mn family superoxide dismutase
MKDISRRDALSRIAGGGAGLALSFQGTALVDGEELERWEVKASSTQAMTVRAFRGQHQPLPLRFDPAKLKGLSEKLINSHWENNYGGAVKALNVVEQKLASMLTEKDLPAYVYGDLKREELVRTGSVILHENYFANLGGDGKVSGKVLDLIKEWFGSYEQWEAESKRLLMPWPAVQDGPFYRTTCTPAKFTIIGPGITCTTRRWVIRFWFSICMSMLTIWTTARQQRNT